MFQDLKFKILSRVSIPAQSGSYACTQSFLLSEYSGIYERTQQLPYLHVQEFSMTSQKSFYVVIFKTKQGSKVLVIEDGIANHR